MVKTMRAVINGQEYVLTQEASTGDWVASVTAPSVSSFKRDGHYYPVQITATDEAGNATTVNDKHDTLGQSCRLVAKEKVAPTVVILEPTAGSYLASSSPVISFQITDNDSGVNLDSVVVKVDGVALTNVAPSAIADGYSFTAVVSNALADGPHIITVDASDNDGNASVQARVSITTDTVPPVLSIAAPIDGLKTNSRSLVVSGITNDITSSPVTLKVNGAAVTINTDGSFSTSVELTEGENIINVVATDAAGKQSVVTRTVTLDTAAPVFVSISMMPNPVDCGATFVIRVKATDD